MCVSLLWIQVLVCFHSSSVWIFDQLLATFDSFSRYDTLILLWLLDRGIILVCSSNWALCVKVCLSHLPTLASLTFMISSEAWTRTAVTPPTWKLFLCFVFVFWLMLFLGSNPYLSIFINRYFFLITDHSMPTRVFPIHLVWIFSFFLRFPFSLFDFGPFSVITYDPVSQTPVSLFWWASVFVHFVQSSLFFMSK